MKFKKDRKSFDSIEDVRAAYCNGLHQCEACAIYRVLTHGKCRWFCEENPRKAAELMEFEIIDDEPTTCELPLDISDMTLAQAKGYCKHLMGEEPPCGKVCDLKKSGICGSGGLPCDWKLDRAHLAPEELEICRKIGAKWVSMDEGGCIDRVLLWSNKPQTRINCSDNHSIVFDAFNGECLGYLKHSKFPSVHPGDCICVEDAGG